jgi:two-component system, chemotaxis family, sensor kinase CheA
VVKNLESNYRKVNDVSGATIMGDGRVALILDVASLVRRSRH